MDSRHLVQELQNLLVQAPRCHDWGARVQEACEVVWDGLRTSSYGAEVLPSLKAHIIQLLQQPDAFALARMVLPELRSSTQLPSHEFVSPDIKDLMQATMRLRLTSAIQFQPQLRSQVNAQYENQRQTLLDAELYRASVFQGYTGHLSDQDKASLTQWLVSKPDCLWYNNGTLDAEQQRAAEAWIASKPQIGDEQGGEF